MRKLILLVLFLIIYQFNWANIDVETLRNAFLAATKDAQKAKALYLYFDKKELINTPLELAYKGATTALMAKFTTGPFTKLKYVKNGLEILNNAVEKDSDNYEIRYLRFSVERNLPAILNSSENIEHDVAIIAHYLINKRNWTNFECNIAVDLFNSNYLNEEQKNKLITHKNFKSNA